MCCLRAVCVAWSTVCLAKPRNFSHGVERGALISNNAFLFSGPSSSDISGSNLVHHVSKLPCILLHTLVFPWIFY